MSTTSESIARLRARFEADQAAHPTFYHPVDIERVRTEDWQVARFLLDQNQNQQLDQVEDKAFAALCKALQWKKSFGLHDRSDADYPLELWTLNDIEVCGRDRAGRLIQWGSIRNKRYFKPIATIARNFVGHVLERADRLAGETGFVIVSDTNGAGLANVDLEMNKFNNAILAHYPLALKAMYIVDLSWVLSSLMKLMMTFVDPRLPVHFVAASELSRYIDPEFIPSGLGDGARLKRSFPSCLRRLDHCYQDHGLEETFVNHFYKVYKLKRSESEPKVEGVDENEVAVKG